MSREPARGVGHLPRPCHLTWLTIRGDCGGSLAVPAAVERGILEKLHRHERYKLIERGTEEAAALAQADRLLDMRVHFDDALVTGWEPLAGSFGLPDVDDEHVLAAAVVGGAGAIVTDNLKHFPADLVRNNIQVLTSREVAPNTADVDPERAARALRVMSDRPPRPNTHLTSSWSYWSSATRFTRRPRSSCPSSTNWPPGMSNPWRSDRSLEDASHGSHRPVGLEVSAGPDSLPK
jgi:hypothetical protein